MVRVGEKRRLPTCSGGLSEVKDDLSKYLRMAEKQGIVITRHGRPAGVLIGFESEDDWFEYQLENDPRFLARIELARQSLREGLATAYVGFTIAFGSVVVEWADQRFAHSIGVPYDEWLDFRARVKRGDSLKDAYTDANTGRLSAADAVRTAVWTLLVRNPEYFIIPREDISPLARHFLARFATRMRIGHVFRTSGMLSQLFGVTISNESRTTRSSSGENRALA